MPRSSTVPRDLPAGARVVSTLPSGGALAELLLSCLDRRLVAVPLDPRTEQARVAEIVARVSASVLVTPDGVSGTGLPAAHPEADGLALIMFTSGSTGAPKGVMLPRAAVLANARATAALHGFGPDRPHGTCLPLHHCNALVMSLLGTHLTDTPLVLHNRFDPAGYLTDLDARGATTASIVPAMLPELLDVAPPWPARLEYLITAAAPLTTDLARRFHETYGPRLRQGYGLTELVNFSTTMPRLAPADWSRRYLGATPPVGEPLPGTEVRLVDGEVWIRSAARMRGYWEDPETTAATLTGDGWLRTGDLGRLDEGLLVLDGRRTERIDRGGEKFYPLDVERSWRGAGLTGLFAAVPVPDDVLGHEIGLVAAELTDEVVDAARRILSAGPRRPATVTMGEFSATATGKPQRGAMGRRLAATHVGASRFTTDPSTAELRSTGLHSRLAERLTALRRHTPGSSAPPPSVRRLDLLTAPDGAARIGEELADTSAAGPLMVLHGPADPDRWALVASLRAAGARTVGLSVLRAGRRDLGGVVWAD